MENTNRRNGTDYILPHKRKITTSNVIQIDGKLHDIYILAHKRKITTLSI